MIYSGQYAKIPDMSGLFLTSGNFNSGLLCNNIAGGKSIRRELDTFMKRNSSRN